MSESEKEYVCPLCRTNDVSDPMLDAGEGRVLCDECESRATDSAGRPVGFHNVGMSGGWTAVYLDGNRGTCAEVVRSHVCFVDGVACFSDERRFGGIYVRLAADELAAYQRLLQDACSPQERIQTQQTVDAMRRTIQQAEIRFAAAAHRYPTVNR